MINEQSVKKLAGEQQIDRIYKLDISNKSLLSVPSLKSFTKLRYLRLDFNRIRCIENLESLTDLRELHLQNNQIAEINGLKGNKSLTVLNLSTNHIEKIENINHLIKLETLTLDENKISKIVGLELLKNLKTFSVSSNNLVSIQSMPSFSKLQVLNLSNNKINKISPNLFDSSNKLINLNLSKNNLKNAAFVAPLSSLQSLNLASNQLIQFPKVYLKNLQHLNLNDNSLESLPVINECFPQLCEYLFKGNYIASDYQVIQSVSQADSISEIDFSGNPMETAEFCLTLFQLFSFDVINGQVFGQPGTRYKEQAKNIHKTIQCKYTQIQDDQQDRKIKMSGFYDDDLEEQVTGMTPNRPLSPSKKKAGTKLNYNDIQKSYFQIVNNDKKIQNLRDQCLKIFKSNNIIPQSLDSFMEEEEEKTDQKEEVILTQAKLQENKIIQPFQMKKITEEQANKWKEIKAREKNFNIRGVVRKMSSSRKVAAKGGSMSKVGNQERQELMKTQVQPPRWNGDPGLLRTTMTRPVSSKKKREN